MPFVTMPHEDGPAVAVEFWRLTQEPPRRHPEALDEVRELLDGTLMEGTVGRLTRGLPARNI